MTRHPLVFIRHGETDWNRALRFQGQRDIPLNDYGRRQAARNGRAVAGILAEREWKLVASPLIRALETMEIVLETAGVWERAIPVDSTLMEVHYGEWEGLTIGEIEKTRRDEHLAREADKWGFAPPGGESYSMLADRVAEWLKTHDEPTLMVAHGGVLRALLHLLAGLPGHDAPHLAVPQDRVMLFTPERVLTI